MIPNFVWNTFAFSEMFARFFNLLRPLGKEGDTSGCRLARSAPTKDARHGRLLLVSLKISKSNVRVRDARIERD